MNSYTVKIMTFFLCLFVLITVTSQIYLAFQDSYKTETAVFITAVDSAVFKGVYVRNETVLHYDGGGVISYPSPDGSKIAKNSPVAYVYDSEQDITTNQTIDKLNKEHELLVKVQNKGTTDVAQPEFLSKLIEEKYQSIAACIEKNDLELLSTERDELLTLLNILQIVTKKETDYSARTKLLAEQIATLTAAKKEPRQIVTTEKAGYFASYTDGYEDIISLDKINDITADEIKAIGAGTPLATKSGSKAIGKIIDSYSWKMVGLVDNSTMRFIASTKVQLKLSSNPQPVTATIDEIKPTDNPHESIIILSCDKLTYDIVQHRSERVELIISDHDGIKVPRKAIRFLNGDKGVYVQMGQSISFKKLDVIFEGDDYVVSSREPKEGYLRLYDDMLVEGLKVADEKAITETIREPDRPTKAGEPSAAQTVVGGTVAKDKVASATTTKTSELVTVPTIVPPTEAPKITETVSGSD